MMLAITTTLFSSSGVCTIDTSGFDRSAANRRYEKRSGYTIRSLKTTLLVDVESLADLSPRNEQVGSAEAGRRSGLPQPEPHGGPDLRLDGERPPRWEEVLSHETMYYSGGEPL